MQNVGVRFGGIVALDDVSFDVAPGADRRPDRPERRRQDHAVQLPRRGSTRCDSGDILFDGALAAAASPRHRIAALGIGRTFQNLRAVPHA